MLYLENELARVEFKTLAAEITSFVDKETGLEHMYDGNPQYWSGRNPILFPMVGSTWNKEVVIDGVVYHMGNHGFCRNAEFTVEHQDETSLTMSLSSSEETLAQYPFEFKLSVTYTLKGKELSIVYHITNNSDRVMPFNFGLHPAFKCPITEGKKFTDYKIEFACPEKLEEYMNHTGYVFEGTDLALNYEMFGPMPTIVFENVKSPYVTLTDGENGVKVSCVGYRWLAFWTKAEACAPYICIEPWHSHSDWEKNECAFEEREGTQFLDSGKTFVTSYTIEVF